MKKRPFSRVLSLKNGLFLVEVRRLELRASWSQTRRSTRWATPRRWKNLWNCSSHRTGQNCGQTTFARVGQTANARFSSVFLAFPRFFEERIGQRPLAPKLRALPAAPHPEVCFCSILAYSHKCLECCPEGLLALFNSFWKPCIHWRKFPMQSLRTDSFSAYVPLPTSSWTRPGNLSFAPSRSGCRRTSASAAEKCFSERGEKDCRRKERISFSENSISHRGKIVKTKPEESDGKEAEKTTQQKKQSGVRGKGVLARYGFLRARTRGRRFLQETEEQRGRKQEGIRSWHILGEKRFAAFPGKRSAPKAPRRPMLYFFVCFCDSEKLSGIGSVFFLFLAMEMSDAIA